MFNKNKIIWVSAMIIALLVSAYYLANKPNVSENGVVANQNHIQLATPKVLCKYVDNGTTYCRRLLSNKCWLNTTCKDVYDQNCGMGAQLPSPCP